MNAIRKFDLDTTGPEAMETLNALVFGQVFDVTHYGAVADSNGTIGHGTDNAEAFARCRAALVAAGGGTFRIPPAAMEYRIELKEFVFLTGNMRFQHEGKVRFDTDDTLTFGRFRWDGSDAPSGMNYNIVVCGGGTITNRVGVVANADAPAYEGYQGQCSGIVMKNIAFFTIEGMEVTGVPNYCISLIWSTDGTVQKNYLHHSNADGVHAQNGCHRVRIVFNDFVELGDDMVGIGYDGAPNTKIVIAWNTGRGCGASGLAIYSPIDGLVITHNNIDGTYNAGIKLAAVAGFNGAGAGSYIRNVQIIGGTIRNAGMRSRTDFSRGRGVPVSIWLVPGNGEISNLLIQSVDMRDTRNGFIIGERPGEGGRYGLIRLFDLLGQDVVAVGGQGPTLSPSTGVSSNPTDATYPGITIKGASHVHMSRCAVFGAAGAPYSIEAETFIDVENYPANDNGEEAALLFSEDFNRPAVVPSVGALGNGWVGQPAGIDATGKAYFAPQGYNRVFHDAGIANMLVRVRVTITGGNHARIYARCTDDVQGPGLIGSTDSNLIWWTGTTPYNIGQAVPPLPDGTYDLELESKGNAVRFRATAVGQTLPVWEKTGSPEVVMGTDTYGGMGDGGGAGGSARFDMFSIAAA